MSGEQAGNHYKANLQDLEFNLFDVFERDEILGAAPFEAIDRETAHDLLEESARVAAKMGESFAADDRNPSVYNPKDHSVTLPQGFKESYRAYRDSGLYLAGMPEELGGTSAPRSLTWGMNEMFAGANPAVYLGSALGIFIAAELYQLGNNDQRRLAQYMVEKGTGATMDLTEPDAGSDVGAGRTTATPQPNGLWHINGVKRFITGGEGDNVENIVHTVLARPEGAGPGTKGLSLFVVPKHLVDLDTGQLGERNGVYAAGIEHKMGIKASPTCEMVFGGEHPAIGTLVGDKHDGIAQMFNIIEGARMMIGVKAAATLLTAYLNALEYATTRIQGPDMTDMGNRVDKTAVINHPEVRASLMMQKAYGEGLRALYMYTATIQDDIQILKAQPVDDQTDGRLQALHARNDLLLPLVKGFGSERANHLLQNALQVYGGSGYLQDFPIEQYIRDAKIDTIYEGTTAIQAKDFFFRKILRNMMKGGDAFSSLMQEVGAFAEDSSGSLLAERELLSEGVQHVEAIANQMIQDAVDSQQPDNKRNIYKVGQNTERLLMATGDVLVGWLLLRQAEVAERKLSEGSSAKDAPFFMGKIVTAQFFAREVLPRLAADRRSAALVDNSIMDLPLEAM